MSPDEILSDLRDIQLPPSAADTAPSLAFNFWPMTAIALLLAGLLALRLWRRQRARRQLKRAIEAFATSPSEGGITALLALRSAAAAQGVVPPSLPPPCFTEEGVRNTAALVEAAQELRQAVR